MDDHWVCERESETEGLNHPQKIDKISSSNQTGQWKIHHFIDVFFQLNPPCIGDFQLPCWITRGYIYMYIYVYTSYVVFPGFLQISFPGTVFCLNQSVVFGFSGGFVSLGSF